MKEIRTKLLVDDPEVNVLIVVVPEPRNGQRHPDTVSLSIEEAEALYVKLGAELIRAKTVRESLNLGASPP